MEQEIIHGADIEAANGEARPRQRAKREATKAAIIDAFERLLTRDGVTGLGVNALVKEAGIGKKQVYDYFGGLPGVAVEWVTTRGVWPPLETLLGEPMEHFVERPPVERIKIINRNYAQMLRRNAPLSELLMGEFTRSAEVQDAVEHVRQLIRRDFEQVVMADPAQANPDHLAINTMAYAASTYIAIRAHCQPRFFGFDLASEMSWQTIMHMLDRVVDMADPDRDKS